MRSYITALMLLATLALMSCGGGNDGASTGTPVVAQATLWSPTDNGGCGNSSTYGYGNSGPSLTNAQYNACNSAFSNVQTIQLCNALGGSASGNNSSGSCMWLLYGGYTSSWYQAY
jgi:hypothetical protein